MDTPPPTMKRFSLGDTEVRFRHDAEKDERERLEEMNQRISSEIEELERSAQSLRVQRDGIMSEGFAARRNKKPVFFEREPKGGERDVSDEPRRQGASADDSGDDDEVDEKVVRNTLTATERSRDRDTSSAVSHTNSSTRVTTRKFRKLMMPKDYDGTSLLSLFLTQFDSCADYNEWDNRDKAAYLRNSLKGNAAHILEDGSGTNASYKELVERLKNRYGTEGQVSLFKMQLKSRRRGKNEPLPSLYHDIRRLSILAYPGLTLTQLDPFATESFISALGDRDLELRVRDKDPDSLDHAFQLTMTAEANAKIYDSSDQRGYEDDRKRQRGYNEKGNVDRVRSAGNRKGGRDVKVR